jgi:hypothetical protein
MSQDITYSVGPIEGHSHTFVLLHDRGGSSHCQYSQFRNACKDSQNRLLRNIFPEFKWVFLSASGPEGQWFASDTAEDVEIMRDNVRRVRQVLSREAARLKGQDDRIILAGIGEGAALAAYVLMSLAIPTAEYPDRDGSSSEAKKLGAFIAFSCSGLPLAGGSADEVRGLLLLGHSNKEVVDFEIVRGTPALLQSCGSDTGQVSALKDLLKEAGASSFMERSVADLAEPLAGESVDNMVQFINRTIRWTPKQVFPHGRWGR